jgi:transposase-like protein
VVDRSVPAGLDLAAAVLRELGLEATSIETWMRQHQDRVLASNVRPLAA